MEKELFKSKNPRRRNYRSANASSFAFDLPGLIEKMKQEHSWTKGELNTMILLKSPNKQIVLTALHEDTVIESFQSNGSITFQIIEGNIKFQTKKKAITLDKGQFLTLHEKTRYSLTTKDETVLLLTIANKNLQPVVN